MIINLLDINKKTAKGRIYDKKVAQAIVDQINNGGIMAKNGPDYLSEIIGQCKNAKINGDKVICEVQLIDSHIEELLNNKNGEFRICGAGDVNRNNVRNYKLSHITTSF